MESLACKYRPHCFADIVGQDVVVSILSKQIATKTFKNAYLLCGPAGLGKTSLARIIAQEINNHESEPIEIDAASNNGVDNIRALAIEAQQASIDADYKVFVIDECHALSNAAWQAALKLIEEPPAQSIFIFCTTNPEKIPDTIMSRVQRFDLKKVSVMDIANRLEFILNEELHKNYERTALERIAIKANGHMREAITLLDKCIDFGDLTLSNVERVLGLVRYEWLFAITEKIINKDTKGCLELLQELEKDCDDYVGIIDVLLDHFIECQKYVKINNAQNIKIPVEYLNKIIDMDYMPIIEMIFKYREICYLDNAKLLLDLLIMELSK